LAKFEFRPPGPGRRLSVRRLARRRRARRLDLAQPQARVLRYGATLLEARVTDVSRLAGHANVRTTLDMYVGTTAGTLDRARRATQ
jgi:integrase